VYKGTIYLIIISLFLAVPMKGYAESPSKLVDKGNKSWLKGDYDDAMAKYEEAAVDNPESPYIYFNKGTVLYQMGDYVSAIDEFERAALKSKDPLFEAKSSFNLGNCAFREAERQQDSDLKKSLEFCEKSIEHFQDALKLDTGFTEAAENIEIVRLFMKNILDKIKKREQEAKEREKEAKENAEKIQELIKRQEGALEKNRQISNSKLKSDKKKKMLDELADEQKNITLDTQELAEKISKQAVQQNQGSENPSLKHLNNAIKEQTAAEGNLRNSAAANAEKNQENAIKELKETLTPPEQNKEGQQKQQEQQENKEQSAEEESSQEQNQSQSEEQAMTQLAEDAQDILNEEKENQKRRQVRGVTGYRDVEKDW
jgi:hypothetical protein